MPFCGLETIELTLILGHSLLLLQDLDLLADDEVSRLRTEMINAADSDEASNQARKPGTSKLKLLPQVVSTLQKCV